MSQDEMGLKVKKKKKMGTRQWQVRGQVALREGDLRTSVYWGGIQL